MCPEVKYIGRNLYVPNYINWALNPMKSLEAILVIARRILNQREKTLKSAQLPLRCYR